MNVKTTVTGSLAVTLCVIVLATMLYPAMGNIQGDHTETAEYLNSGPQFALVDENGTAHTMEISLIDGEYVVTTDGTIARYLDEYVKPTQGIATAIGIGVYEAYNDDGILTSQSGVMPTAEQTLDQFRSEALANNTDVTMGTYQLWNFYQYTLTKIMGFTVMGNTDSQYMMGNGVVNGSRVNTGTTSSAYTRSTSNATAECLFIENAWGNINDYVGDVNFYNMTMNAGNTLGGKPVANVVSTLTSTVTLPTSKGVIGKIYLTSEAFGVPKTTGSNVTAGQGINDYVSQANGYTVLGVGGRWTSTATAGMSCFFADNPLNHSQDRFTTRLAYVIDDRISTRTFAYKITFDETNTTTTISNVQVLEDGELKSKMPTGTALNGYWSFGEDGYGPFGCYYACINRYDGANTDDATEQRISTGKGEIGYILDPNNLHQTLAGTTFDGTQYNVMLIIPTVYWYCDPDTKELYIGSEADSFDGITMRAYAHEYTIDDTVITGNPVKEVQYDSIPIVIGSDSMTILYSSGDVKIKNTSGTENVGSANDTLILTITDGTLDYGNTQGNIRAYAVSEGEYSLIQIPTVQTAEGLLMMDLYDERTRSAGFIFDGTTLTVLDPQNYISGEVIGNTVELDTGAMRIEYTATTEWDDGMDSKDMSILAPNDVTVEYTINGVSDNMMKILIAIGILALAGVLIFAIRIIRF